MNYYPIFFLFVSFLEIFNSHAILIECYVADIYKLDKDNYPEYINFCKLDIPSEEITHNKINLNNLKNIIKNKNKLVTDPNTDKNIINNIEKYIILNAYHYTYGITYLNFESGNIIIPDYDLKKLKNEENGENNCIVLNFLSEENFKKLKSITIKNLLATVEGETKSYIKINISLKNLQEGFYKESLNFSILNHIMPSIKKKIEKFEKKLKMKFLNDGSDFRILQDGNEINILQCLQTNKFNNLSIELQFSYKLIFEVEYKSENEEFEVRDDFEEEDFKNENENIFKKIKHSNDLGEGYKYFKQLCITFLKKNEFINKLRKNFYSEDNYNDLKFIINNTDVNSVDISTLLGKKNNLKVICSKFSEYVKSYVIRLRFSVNNIPAGIWESEYSICKELNSIQGNRFAFTKKEDITAENIIKKINLINKEAIDGKITIKDYKENSKNIPFTQDKFFDSIELYLGINEDYAKNNKIISKKENPYNKPAKNNFNADVKIFGNKKSESGNYNQQNFDIDINKDNKNNKDIKNLNPKCCCDCCLNCCK